MTNEIQEIFEKIKEDGRTALLEHEAKTILKKIGVNIPPSKIVSTEADALKTANEFGLPVVMKLMSPQVLHKTDMGAVVVGLDTEEKVQAIYQDFMKRFSDVDVAGVLVEKMVKPGIELIVGTQIDKTFGPVILVGPGGIFVEALKDVVFRMCPTSKDNALSAIDEIKTQNLLNGFRGMPKVDRNGLARLVEQLSKLAWEYKDYIGEMDINPIIANEDGLFPVDARIILKE